MASPRAILAAAKAGRPTPAPQGSWLQGAAPQPGSGYAHAYGQFLPRPPEVFTDGAFGPFSPILTVPVDRPAAGELLPTPRREQYQVGWNLPTGTPGSEGLKLASFDVLKSLADLYSVARACIQVRKQEILGLDWDITMTRDAEKAYRGSKRSMRDFGERQGEAKRFFTRPDPDYWTFGDLLNDMLEQILVFDALTLFFQPVRAKGLRKGLLGSDLDCLQLIDGQTIRPLYDLHGASPRPPAPAWSQYLYGVPRSDFTDVLSGRDLAESGLAAERWIPFTRSQMLYYPMVRRRWTPYGFPPVERALIPIMSGLQKQGYQLDYYREGTVPSVYISPGDVNMTANQIRELQDALNALAGDPAWHHKVIVLPPGSKTEPQKNAQLADDFDSIVMTQVCMAFDVRPMEIGILPQVSTVASPFAAREMAQAARSMTQRTSTKPMLKFLAGIFTGILQGVCGQRDMQFVFSGMQEVQDQAAMTDMLVKQVQSGIRSVDEARDQLELPPWGLDETSAPVVFTAAGPLPFSAVTAVPGITGGDGTAQPAPQVQPPAGAQAALTGAHAAAQAAIAGAPDTRALPPGTVTERQRGRGGRLAPAHATAEGSPGHSGQKPLPKAAAAELDALTRHLRKGRQVSTWQPVHIPARALAIISEDLAKGLSPEQAAGVAKTIILGAGEWSPKAAAPPGQPPSPAQQQAQAQQLAQQYAQQIQQAFTQAAAQAARLIARWAAGTLAVTLATLTAMIAALIAKALTAVLTSLWRDAWALGRAAAEAAAGRTWDTAAAAEALTAFLATWGADLAGLISQTRMRQLAAALTEAIRRGVRGVIGEVIERILRVTSRADMIAVTEITRAMNAAAEKAYGALGVAYKTWQTMRDGKVCARCLGNQNEGPIPLSGVFLSGLAHPPQHPRCRCWLAPWFPPPPVNASKTIRVNTGGEIAPAGGEPPRPRRADGTPLLDIPGGVPGATAGGEPPRWDASEPHPGDRGVDGGDDDDEQGTAPGTGTPASAQWPAPYMDGYWPPAAAKAAGAAARYLKDAPAADPAAVHKVMAGNFPPAALKWVRKARWAGPVDVPIELVDFAGEDTWAASRQKGHVNQLARTIKAGGHVNPVIGTVKPGHNHMRIVDGHHRTLAYRQLGRPVRAYVAFLDKAGPSPADRTYQQQFHSGASPANKGFTAGNLGGAGNVAGLVPFDLAGQPSRSKESVHYRPADNPARSCGTCVMFRPGGTCTLVAGDISPAATCDKWSPGAAAKAAEPYVAGLMVRARDTGRVLMIQRALSDDQDHAAGCWEPPGGHADPGETLLDAARREWAEETGLPLPTGTLTGSWDSGNGIYRGYVLDIPAEAALDLAARDGDSNPDGDAFEAVAWFDPAQFEDNPSMRPEMAGDLPQVRGALNGHAAKSAQTPVLEATPHPLGPHGLWRTPDRHVPYGQKLPNYVEHIAAALMRDQGLDESAAIAYAISAIKRWAAGDLHWGHGKVTPEVRAASQRALQEWEHLKETHHDLPGRDQGPARGNPRPAVAGRRGQGPAGRGAAGDLVPRARHHRRHPAKLDLQRARRHRWHGQHVHPIRDHVPEHRGRLDERHLDLPAGQR